MIAEGELRRLAAQWRVDPMTLNLDYSLTWLLAALFATEGVTQALRFKGGTCLRKCYFPGYRFSEDLDFTAMLRLTPERLSTWVNQAQRWSAERDGPNFAAAPLRQEVVADEYGKESYQLRLYFRGPLQWDGSPQVVRLDVTRDEQVLLPAVARPLHHAYSDAPAFAGQDVVCYALLEILAEKVRAVSGQRRFTVSRDVYDIYHLAAKQPDIAALASMLPAKFETRGVNLSALDPAALEQRRGAFELDWHRRLDYLIPHSEAVSFEQAWSTTLAVITELRALL